tara:strand:+ start:441 stop:617 length:177 start_codon:yes stop_codon:yes gene_type:complete
MNTYTEAKERVCKSLLTRINVYDEKLSLAKEKENLDLVQDFFLRQTSLINRLEQVLTH